MVDGLAKQFARAALAKELGATGFDPTEPGPRPARGTLHPITIVQNELVDLLGRTARLAFRPVLQVAPGTPTTVPTPSPSPSPL